jgi:hypothetical protein
MKRYTKTTRIASIKDVENFRKDMEKQGWTDSMYIPGYQPWKGMTEKLIVYAWRWHGEWSGWQKGYMTTMYR